MHMSSQPLVVLYASKRSGNKTIFIGRNGLVEINGKSRVIQRILCFCNGLNTVSEIVGKMSGTDSRGVVEILDVLEERGIVRDSRELYLAFHEDSSSASEFTHELTTKNDGLNPWAGLSSLQGERHAVFTSSQVMKSDLLDMMGRRHSTREFKRGNPSKEFLFGAMISAYGKFSGGHRSVPSGGGLYTLFVYLLVLNDYQCIPKGVYRWVVEHNQLIGVECDEVDIWITKTFNAQTVLENASFVVCIGADLDRSAVKYSNRGYRLVLLEAGHSAQNVSLFCAEQGLGCVEYCGFDDLGLAQNLGLKFPREAILTTLIIGVPDDQTKAANFVSDVQMVAAASKLYQSLVIEAGIVRDVSVVEIRVRDYTMPLWVAECTYQMRGGQVRHRTSKRDLAFATAAMSSEAMVKVLAEAFERYAAEHGHSDFFGDVAALDAEFLDPRIYTPYTPYQFDRLGDITPFDPRKKIEWVVGTRQNGGSKVWIPRDLVYFSENRSTQKGEVCYRASSSGVAAHFDRDIAIRSALYELIERDAFCVTWFSERKVPSVLPGLLPGNIRSRILHWERMGYKVTVLDITIDGPPVVMVLIWSESKSPALCSGAACRPCVMDAIRKAFDEAEFMAMTWHRRKSVRGMQFEDIVSPDDHGLFFVDHKNLGMVEWLLKSPVISEVRPDFEGDLSRYDPIVVDITPPNPSPGLVVVRVLSAKLMPINFGYGNEHRGHLRMDELGYKWSMDYPSNPHFFA